MNHNDDYRQENNHNGGSRIRMLGGEPGEEYGQGVLTETQSDIRNRFRQWSHRRPHGCLASVCGQRNETSKYGGEELFARRKLGRGCIGQQSRNGHTHKRVERIPDQVKGWNFVRKEFDDEHDDAGCNDPPTFEQTERVGERKHIECWSVTRRWKVAAPSYARTA